MQVRFDTGKAVGYFILVPEKCRDVKIHVYQQKEAFGFIHKGKQTFIDIENDFIPLGTLGKLTEEQAEVIVDYIKPFMSKRYRDYSDKKDKVFVMPFTAIESLKSLADCLQVYNVNPLGEKPKYIPESGEAGEWKNLEILNQWQSAEARTGRWEIIFKLK